MKMRTAQWIGMAGLVIAGFLGCSKTPKDTSKVLVSLADQKITESEFTQIVKVMVGDDKRAEQLLKNGELKEQRNQFLESLAIQKALFLVAKAEGLDKDSKTKVLIEQDTAKIYVEALTDRRMPKEQPTEAELKGLYDTLVAERKAEGQDKNIPAYEEVKAQLPAVWRQKKLQEINTNLFKEIRNRFPMTFADGYKPTPQPGQP